MTDITSTNSSFGNRVVNKLPESIQNQLNTDQKLAVAKAATETRSSDWFAIHKIDLHYSIPFFGARYYLRILFGPEKRPVIRINADKKNGFLRTIGKILLIGIFAATFYTLVGLTFLLYSSVLT